MCLVQLHPAYSPIEVSQHRACVQCPLALGAPPCFLGDHTHHHTLHHTAHLAVHTVHHTAHSAHEACTAQDGIAPLHSHARSAHHTYAPHSASPRAWRAPCQTSPRPLSRPACRPLRRRIQRGALLRIDGRRACLEKSRSISVTAEVAVRHVGETNLPCAGGPQTP